MRGKDKVGYGIWPKKMPDRMWSDGHGGVQKQPCNAILLIHYFLGVTKPIAVSSTNSTITSSPALNFSRPSTL